MDDDIYAYVGSRTTRERQAKGDGITVFKYCPESSNLEAVQVVGGLVNPSYLTLSRDQRFLYAVHGDRSDISAFKIEQSNGALSLLNQTSTGGRNPVFLTMDPEYRHIIVANHLGSSLAVLPVAQDGRIQPVSQLLPLKGRLGPHRTEQSQSKPHADLFDPSGRFMLVPDKGLDCIFVFEFKNGALQPAAHPCVPAREGAGPRHLVFHPVLPVVYVINELDSTVTVYVFDPTEGLLQPVQVLSSLPQNYCFNNRCAAIGMTKDGRFLYASNRGADSISAFSVNPEDGRLEFSDSYSTQGSTPRHFSITPDGRTVFALNEQSHNIVAFHIDPQSGALIERGKTVDCGSPVCMIFASPHHTGDAS